MSRIFYYFLCIVCGASPMIVDHGFPPIPRVKNHDRRPATANAVPYVFSAYRGFRSHRWRSLHTTAKFLLPLTRFYMVEIFICFRVFRNSIPWIYYSKIEADLGRARRGFGQCLLGCLVYPKWYLVDIGRSDDRGRFESFHLDLNDEIPNQTPDIPDSKNCEVAWLRISLT